jgi:hypothetical protein
VLLAVPLVSRWRRRSFRAASLSRTISSRSRRPSVEISASSITRIAIPNTVASSFVAVVVLADSALADLRNWFGSVGGQRWLRSPAGRGGGRAVVDLVISSVRGAVRRFDTTDPETPTSAWRIIAVADDDIAPGLVVHLRMGDNGDSILLVDRVLVVVALRIEGPPPDQRTFT